MSDHMSGQRPDGRVDPTVEQRSAVDPHDWRPADLAERVEVRKLNADHYQLRHPDGQLEDLDTAGFDRWRDLRDEPPERG